MAEIKPIRAWRYNQKFQSKIDKLVSPLFDVISVNQRELLYKEEFNSIHLSVPDKKNPVISATRKLIDWKKKQIIIQDELPAIYVYYQYFTLPGSPKTYCRKGFVANIRIYEWNENVLLRHENTIPHSVNDRIEILEKTLLNVSPTHGLYTDEKRIIEPYLDIAIQRPIYETEDYQGVRDVFGVIHDASIINLIINTLKHRQIILADGHHRYEGSLLYKKKKANSNPVHTGNEAYNFHMMYFTNTESDDIRILPTHRLIVGLENFDSDNLINQLSNYFNVKYIEDPFNLNEVILGKKSTFGLLLHDKAFMLELKEELIDEISWKFPDSIKKLDLTVMHYYIIEKCLGIAGKHQRNSKNLYFERNFSKCVHAVDNEEAQCAIISQDISIETVKKVCYSGYTLPQKSTYFYPKVICGFLFGSIKEDEFESYFDNAYN